MRSSFVFIPVFVVLVLLTVAVSLKTGKGPRVVYRESGERIVNWAMAIALFGLALIFAILMIVNNPL